MLAVIIIGGILGAGYGLLVLRAKSREAKMRVERDGVNVESFIREFEGSPYDRSVLETAYSDLAELSRLPVRKGDDLEKTLGFLPEDFERVLEKRCRALGVDDVQKSPHASLFPLKTAEDYVRFLSAVMDGQQSSAKKG